MRNSVEELTELAARGPSHSRCRGRSPTASVLRTSSMSMILRCAAIPIEQPSSQDSLEQQRKLQGALARLAPLEPRIAAVRSAGAESRIRDSSV